MNTCRYLTSLEATGWMNAVGTALRSTENTFYAKISVAKNTCQLVLLLTIIAIIARIIIIVVIIRLARDVAERVHHGKLVVLIEGEGRTCSPMVNYQLTILLTARSSFVSRLSLSSIAHNHDHPFF